MTLGHEKLDVYRLSIDYVAWVYEKSGGATAMARDDFDPDSDFDLDREQLSTHTFQTAPDSGSGSHWI